MGKIKEIHHRLKKAKGSVVKTVRPGFWKKALRTMHPREYEDLSEVRLKKGINYLLSLLLAAFVIMAIISLPRIIEMPSYIESELAKFDMLNISMDAETSSPVMLTEHDPQIIIDTKNNITEMGSEKILITDDYIYYRPYARARRYNISEFKDITSKKGEISRFLTFIIILLIPTILITLYIMFLIKYVITIAVAALLLLIILRVAKKKIGIIKALNTALYSSTPMVLIEVIMVPFNSKYLVPIFQVMGMNFYLITLLIYIALVGFCSYFAVKQSHDKKGKKQVDYPEMEKIEWDY